MKIRNRKTGIEYIIDKEAWGKLTDQKLSRNYEVIDATDLKVQGKIVIPQQVIEFQRNPQKLIIKKIEDDESLKSDIKKVKPKAKK